jgi:hypothetical protein
MDVSKSCGFVVDLSKSCGFVVDLSKICGICEIEQVEFELIMCSNAWPASTCCRRFVEAVAEPAP